MFSLAKIAHHRPDRRQPSVPVRAISYSARALPAAVIFTVLTGPPALAIGIHCGYPTQNQAITSRWTLVLIGTLDSGFFAFSVFGLSAFTMHHHRPFWGSGFALYCNRSGGRISGGSAPANLQLH